MGVTAIESDYISLCSSCPQYFRWEVSSDVPPQQRRSLKKLPLGLIVDTSHSLTWEYWTGIQLLRTGLCELPAHLKRIGETEYSNKEIKTIKTNMRVFEVFGAQNIEGHPVRARLGSWKAGKSSAFNSWNTGNNLSYISHTIKSGVITPTRILLHIAVFLIGVSFGTRYSSPAQVILEMRAAPTPPWIWCPRSAFVDIPFMQKIYYAAMLVVQQNAHHCIHACNSCSTI